MSAAKHTPGPWLNFDGLIESQRAPRPHVIGAMDNPADAERAVQCVNAHDDLLRAMDAVSRFIGGAKDRLGRPDQSANAEMGKARADVLELARLYGVAGPHLTILDQCAAVLRAAALASETKA